MLGLLFPGGGRPLLSTPLIFGLTFLEVRVYSHIYAYTLTCTPLPVHPHLC